MFNGKRRRTEFVRTVYSCGFVGSTNAVDVTRFLDGGLYSFSVSRPLTYLEREKLREGMILPEEVRIVSCENAYRGGETAGFNEAERFFLAETSK